MELWPVSQSRPTSLQVLEHESIKRLTRKVKLRTAPRTSRFWRYHNKGEGHVSSVEGAYEWLLDDMCAKPHAPYH